MGSKLPKHILRKKGLTMKQKWALHKRGGKAKSKSKGGYVKKGKRTKKKAWGIGRIIGFARIADVLTRPMQHVWSREGDMLHDSARFYSGGLYKEGGGGAFNQDDYATNTYGAMGTGLAVNHLKSKLGVYRGAGKLKLLDIVSALTPEIQAYADSDPTKGRSELNLFLHRRMQYDAGMGGSDRSDPSWSISPNVDSGRRFWQDKALVVGLKVVQKLVFNTNGPIGLNKYFPKDVNF